MAVAETFVVPATPAVAVPLLLILATLGSLEAQLTCDVIVCVEKSLKVPTAVKLSLVPGFTEAPEGAMAIELRVALVTCRLVLSDIVPRVAWIVVSPAAVLLARPLPAPMVATDVFEELQVTRFDTLWVLPSVSVPVAPNCSLVIWAIVAFFGEILIETTLARSTVIDVLPLTPPKLAVIVAVPCLFPVATPLFEVTDATPFAEELQTQTLVISWEVPSENVPFAANFCSVNIEIVGFAGVTRIKVGVAFVTVSVADPETPFKVAVMVVVPLWLPA
jgi:hypothetical protein